MKHLEQSELQLSLGQICIFLVSPAIVNSKVSRFYRAHKHWNVRVGFLNFPLCYCSH